MKSFRTIFCTILGVVTAGVLLYYFDRWLKVTPAMWEASLRHPAKEGFDAWIMIVSLGVVPVITCFCCGRKGAGFGSIVGGPILSVIFGVLTMLALVLIEVVVRKCIDGTIWEALFSIAMTCAIIAGMCHTGSRAIVIILEEKR